MKVEIDKEELLEVYWCIRVNTETQKEDLDKLDINENKEDYSYHSVAYESSLSFQTKLEILAKENNINLFE